MKGSSEVIVSIVGTQIGSLSAEPKEDHSIETFSQNQTLTDPSLSHIPKPAEIVVEESSLPPHLIKTNSKPRKGNVRTTTMIEILPNDPQGGEDDDDDEDDETDDGNVFTSQSTRSKETKSDKWKVMNLLEFIICVCILIVFINSLAVHKLHTDRFWGLEVWKWCVLLLVFFYGRGLTAGFINALVFLIERNYVLKKKVLYFVHSLKSSVQVLVWLALVLFTWVILIRKGLEEPKETTVVLRHTTRFLVSSLFGAGMWVVKTLLVKILACSFHVKRYFDRIQDSIFHQYVLLALSKPPPHKEMLVAKGRIVLILQKFMKGKIIEKQTIDIDQLNKMIKDTISASTISGLVSVVQGSRLSTISNALDERVITSEKEAKKAANQIFKNAAMSDHRYITEADLLRFMSIEDANKVFEMFSCAEGSRKIKRPAMRKWVVKVYKERELLAQSLNDAKTAIEDMNKILSGLALVVIIVVWLILMGLATTEVLIFLSSQLLAAVFIFGNTCKTVFECIIFIFVMHPFDMGDHCVINGVQMVVEEMKILTTVFRSDNDIIIYPNSVLATTPISNNYRSPKMPENVEFVIDVSTPADTIAALKTRIKAYIEKKAKHWHPDHSFKEIKNGNELKMVLYVNPTTKSQDDREKRNRIAKLLRMLKEIFEEIEIKYHYLPQVLKNVQHEANDKI